MRPIVSTNRQWVSYNDIVQLSIIILSYNTQEILGNCLASLVTLQNVQIGKDFEVVVVDNASSDGSAHYVAEHFPQVKLVLNETNLGFSKANNVGVQATSDTPYVLFLNSDTIVPEGTLDETLRYIEKHPDVGVLTCRVELWSGGLDWDSHRGLPTPWASLTRLLGLAKRFPRSKLFNQYYRGWEDMESIHGVDAVVGAFMLLPRTVGEQIGWWDEDYFLNGEDIDFCFQVTKRGYKVVYYPHVHIVHYRGASKGTRSETRKISKASYTQKKTFSVATMDAMQMFYNKNLRGNYPWILNVLVDIGITLLKKVRLIKVRLKR